MVQVLSVTFILFITLQLCWAASYVPLDLSSSLYTFGPGWTRTSVGTYETTNGSVQITFKGSNISVPTQTTPNPDASMRVFIDGRDIGVQDVGYLSSANLQTDDDHQLIIQATAPQSSPYVFSGIRFPSNTTILNITQHLPASYGINATNVTSDALILDNTHPCVRYSKNTGWVTEEENWTSYNGSIAVSRGGVVATMSIYFHGTDIWLFSSLTELKVPSSLYIRASIDTTRTRTRSGEQLLYPTAYSGDGPYVTPNYGSYDGIVSGTPLNQRFMWSETNLTDEDHVLTLEMAHGQQDTLSFDFARVKGTARDCSGLPDPYIPYGTNYNGNIYSSWLEILIVVICTVPVLFCCCCCGFCFVESRKYSTKPRVTKTKGVYTPIRSEGNSNDRIGQEEEGIEEGDSASFVSVMSPNQQNGPRALPFSATSIGWPIEVSLQRTAAAEISPFTTTFTPSPSGGSPYSSGQYEMNVITGARREGKWAANHAQFSGVGAAGSGVLVDLGEGDRDTISSVLQTEMETSPSGVQDTSTGFGQGTTEGLETTSYGVESSSGSSSALVSGTETHTGDGMRNSSTNGTANGNALELNTSGLASSSSPSLPRNIGSPGSVSGWSPSPPPSYITDGQHAPGVRLLTQADLGRLVDRVTALRIRGRNGALPVIGDVGIVEQGEGEEEEEDPVEALARRIVQAREERQGNANTGASSNPRGNGNGPGLKARAGGESANTLERTDL